MATESKTTDLRIRRTRALLEKAFIELVSERNFQDITIQDIADRAMVNRATFYDHFADKYALGRYSVKSGFQRAIEAKLPANFDNCQGHISLLIITVCEFVAHLDDSCGPTANHGTLSFDEQIVELIGELMRMGVDNNPGMSLIDEMPTVLNSTLASWAIFGAARHWSRQKRRPPLEAYAATVNPTICEIIGLEVVPVG